MQPTDARMKLHHVDLKCSDILMSWYLLHILSLFVFIFLQLSCSRADDIHWLQKLIQYAISLLSGLEHHLNRRYALSNTCVVTGVPILKPASERAPCSIY